MPIPLSLIKTSAHNMVRLELPDPAGNRNKYQQAARLFRQWQDEGILITDEKPAFYFYEQRFTDAGRQKVRRGFFAALRLEDPQKGEIKPHERTLAKPKADRLRLLRAVRANLSPIFGLFNDRGGRILRRTAQLARTTPLATATDDDRVTHRLWRIDDAATVKQVTGALQSQNIFIADGHHRYETAWNYLQERRRKGGKAAKDAEYNYVLAFLCPMEDPGLSIWPTHRVVVPPQDLEQRIAQYFDVLPAARFASCARRSPQPLLLNIGGKSRTLVVKNNAILQKMMPGKCKAYRELGVSILHALLLPAVPPETITYVKSEKEALRLARERKCLAVIVPATPVAAVKEIALAGQTMPQKSTYFYPKIASGIVIHTV
jgi:uncharacterized protein (DUF1015 family)